MSTADYSRYGIEAEQEFEQARRRALFERIRGVLLGRSTDLVPFDQLQFALELRSAADRGLQDISLDAIVGSVGKHDQFTRSLRPAYNRLKERWKQIYVLTNGFRGLPPIDVYQVGEVYFIIDGHYRASVARQMGNTKIEAHVMEFASPVPLSIKDVDNFGFRRRGRTWKKQTTTMSN